MHTTLRRAATAARKLGFESAVTHADGVLALSVWSRDHKPHDYDKAVDLTLTAGKWTTSGGLVVPPVEKLKAQLSPTPG